MTTFELTVDRYYGAARPKGFHFQAPGLKTRTMIMRCNLNLFHIEMITFDTDATMLTLGEILLVIRARHTLVRGRK